MIYLQFVDTELSRKILSAAREQRRELEYTSTSAVPKLDCENDSESEEEEEDTLEPDTFYENIEINEEDERAMEMFMNNNAAPRRTLGDVLAERLTEVKSHFTEEGSVINQDFPPRVEQMYKDIGEVLKKYRSGKLPKPFKFIPTLVNWEQALYITGNLFLIF